TIDAMLPILNKNDFHDVDNELVKLSGIFGHAFEIHYLDRNGDYRIKAISPMNMVMCYSMDLDSEPLAAIYYNTVYQSATGAVYRTYEVYTK
ncbi:phage portal protein, partial [Streptomyces scabiei]|uniref:phage portal protein n=1 Tax=Streptomyces scabiei TaxID=1930 RepID=UPI0038F7A313